MCLTLLDFSSSSFSSLVLGMPQCSSPLPLSLSVFVFAQHGSHIRECREYGTSTRQRITISIMNTWHGGPITISIVVVAKACPRPASVYHCSVFGENMKYRNFWSATRMMMATVRIFEWNGKFVARLDSTGGLVRKGHSGLSNFQYKTSALPALPLPTQKMQNLATAITTTTTTNLHNLFSFANHILFCV